jgi:hypothetical protein
MHGQTYIKFTFKYSPNLPKHVADLEIDEKPGNQSLHMQFSSIIHATAEHFSTGLSPFSPCEETAKCIQDMQTLERGRNQICTGCSGFI